ncbi:MAG: glycosyltransferase 87 family protein [Fluviicola sp.]|nr:glycosyltransferase 87 family protein [Fluviicola sp.]
MKRAGEHSFNKQSALLPHSTGEWVFMLFLVAFCLLFTLVELKNGRLWTNDLRVYYEATNDFFAGNNPYQHAYGLATGFFKYPPSTLYLFSPQSWMSFGTAQLIHIVMLSSSLIVSMSLIRNWVNQFQLFGNKPVSIGFSYLLFATVAIHLTRELHMGNVNLLLLLLFCLGIQAFLTKKMLAFAVFWSLMLMLKPILILVVIPLIIYNQLKVVFMMAGIGLLLALLPIIQVGWAGNVQLWQDWFSAVAAHGDYLTSFNSIGSLVHQFTGFSSDWLFSILFLAFLVTLMVRERFKGKTSISNVVAWTCVLSAAVPNFFVTDTEHFLLSMPLIYMLIIHLIKHKKWVWWSVFALGMLFFSFNSSDLLGPDLTDIVFNYGFLGMGNLIFIGLFLGLKSKPIQSQQIELAG